MQINALSINQFRQYEITFNYFYSFIGKNVEIKTITTQQAEDFVMYLRLDCNLQSVTAAKKIGYISSMFNFALRSGYIKTNPFAFVKVEKKVKEVKPLTTEEFVKIMNVELNEKLNKVRDLFLFQCETACAFSDAQSIRFCDIERDENGRFFVNKPRKKTGIPFFAVLSPLAMNILKKYNYSLDFISNQKCNEYLKQIATICEITKPLHSHIARHTAATRMLNGGVGIHIVQKVLGHTTPRQTVHYAKTYDNTVCNAVTEFQEKQTELLKVGNW